MMESTPKRIAKACRIYEGFLSFYPASFRQEYGELLNLQFKDELVARMKEGRRFSQIPFWVFIVFDVFCSSLAENLQEAVNMDPKKLTSHSVIAAALTAVAWMVIWGGGNISFIGRSEIVSLSLFSLILVGGSITLLGVIEIIFNHKVFRLLSIPLLLFTGIFVVENFSLITGSIWLPDLLGYAVFEFIYWFTMFGYFLLVLMVGVGVLIKRQWLPAASMLLIALPVLVNPFVNLFNALWIITLFGVLSSAGWLAIAWWLKRGNTALPLTEPVETA